MLLSIRLLFPALEWAFELKAALMITISVNVQISERVRRVRMAGVRKGMVRVGEFLLLIEIDCGATDASNGLRLVVFKALY